MINWEKYREKFPVTQNQTYFMTAGAGALPYETLNAIKNRYDLVGAYGGRVFGENISIMEKCRERIAHFINTDPETIAFIPNVSYGMNALSHALSPTKNVLLAKNDFASTVLPWKHSHHTIHWASSLQDLAQHQNNQIDVIVASYIHFANGYKLDLQAPNAFKKNARLIVNGTQGIGAFPIDVKKQGIDALVCSCYKWLCCGEGISFMYVNPDFFSQLTPNIVGWRSVKSAMSFDGSSQFYQSARVFELGWDNLTIFAGLETSLDLIDEIGISNIELRIQHLMTYLIENAKKQRVPILSNINSNSLSGILLLGPFDDLEKVNKVLENNNIWITMRDGGIRVSLHYYNNGKRQTNDLLVCVM